MKAVQVELDDKLVEMLDIMRRDGLFHNVQEAIILALIKLIDSYKPMLAERFQREDIAWALAQKLISEMSPEDKTQLLERVVRDLGDAFPGIEASPDVCGGEARIVRTRIPVWVLERARQLGTSEADLLRSYPSLRAEDIANAWAYARSHREEIERDIRENEAA